LFAPQQLSIVVHLPDKSFFATKFKCVREVTDGAMLVCGYQWVVSMQPFDKSIDGPNEQDYFGAWSRNFRDAL